MEAMLEHSNSEAKEIAKAAMMQINKK